MKQLLFNITLSITTIALALLASACAVDDSKLKETPTVFNWLQNADVDKDIKAALNQQDFRLIAIAGRGRAIPGLNAEQAREGKAHCGSKFVSGLGDSYRKDLKHWWQQARNYAKAYNLKMIGYCLRHK